MNFAHAVAELEKVIDIMVTNIPLTEDNAQRMLEFEIIRSCIEAVTVLGMMGEPDCEAARTETGSTKEFRKGYKPEAEGPERSGDAYLDIITGDYKPCSE